MIRDYNSTVNDGGDTPLSTTCPDLHCGRREVRPLRWQIFRNGTRHIRAACVCGQIWFVIQSARAVAAADANEPHRPTETPSLFDGLEGGAR